MAIKVKDTEEKSKLLEELLELSTAIVQERNKSKNLYDQVIFETADVYYWLHRYIESLPAMDRKVITNRVRTKEKVNNKIIQVDYESIKF